MAVGRVTAITLGPDEKSAHVSFLIDRDAPRQEVLPFLSEHPMIRPLSEYQRFVHDAFQKEVHT